MKIGVSGAFLDRPNTGSGQYVINLLPEMAATEPSHAYYILLPNGVSAKDLGEMWQPIPCQAPMRQRHLAKLWTEQISVPRQAYKAHLDLLHIPYFAPPWDNRTPVIVTIHDLIPLILPAYRASRWVQAYTSLVSLAAQRAHCVLTDSQASARDITRYLDIPPERIRVVYLAAHRRYRPIPSDKSDAILARLGIKTPYFLYLGGFDVRKNLQNIFAAFAAIRSQVPDYRLVVAGKLPKTDTPFAPDPRRLAEEQHLGNAVMFPGWIEEEDKPALYSGAQAFLFPSHYEGFGLPVLEAIACGTPAIVGDGSSLKEIAGDGGLVVDPNDSEACAQQMLALASDPQRRQTLSDLGLQHASQFSWRKTAIETLEAYRATLKMLGKEAS